MATDSNVNRAIAKILANQLEDGTRAITRVLLREMATSLGDEAARLWISSTWDKVLKEMKGHLIATSVLESTVIKEANTKANTKAVTAYSADDKEFMTWYIGKLEGVSMKNRLRLRMFLLAAMENIGEIHGLAWKNGIDRV